MKSFKDAQLQEDWYYYVRTCVFGNVKPKNAAANRRSALCLSGGGIRSAAFCLGVMRALARKNQLLSFNYFSTVSGGGFAGSFVILWISRLFAQGLKPQQVEREIASKDAFARNPLIHLRRYSNYLTPRVGAFSLDSLTGGLIYTRNFVVNLLLMLPFLIAALLIVLAVVNTPVALNALGFKNSAPFFLVIGLFLAVSIYSFMLRNGASGLYQLGNKHNRNSPARVVRTLRRYSSLYFFAGLSISFSVFLIPYSEFSVYDVFKAAASPEDRSWLQAWTMSIWGDNWRFAYLSASIFTIATILVSVFSPEHCP